MIFNGFTIRKIDKFCEYLCNPLVTKNQVISYCNKFKYDLFNLNYIRIEQLTRFSDSRYVRYRIIHNNFNIYKQSLPPEELYQRINLYKYSKHGIFGLYPGIIVKSWLYGSNEFARIMKIFLSILFNLNLEWRNTIENNLITYNGIKKMCHRLECNCNNFDECKIENDLVWNNQLDENLFDLDIHIGKDDYTVLDALISISSKYSIPDPRNVIPQIFPDTSIIRKNKRMPWIAERLLWIANKKNKNNFYILPKELILMIIHYYNLLYR